MGPPTRGNAKKPRPLRPAQATGPQDAAEAKPEPGRLARKHSGPAIFLGLTAWVWTAAGPGWVEAAEAAGPQRWEPEIRAFEAADRTNPPPKGGILFIGSSSIRLWTTLAQDFPEHPVLNRGFGGSQIADAVYFADRIVLPYAPRLIVMYAGGNDIHAGKSPEQVCADFWTFVQTVRRHLPQTRIAYIAIAPNPARWAEVDRVRAANACIHALCRTNAHLAFIDVFPHMLGPDGQPRPELFSSDRLHMNAQGYALWRRLVRPYLDEPKPQAPAQPDTPKPTTQPRLSSQTSAGQLEANALPAAHADAALDWRRRTTATETQTPNHE